MLTQERLMQIARKLRTYAEIYTGDKEARAMADDCELAAAVGTSVGAEMVMVPIEPDRLVLATMVREYVGADRYARDHEYCDAQFAEPARRAYRAIVANYLVGADVGTNETTVEKSADTANI